jgi:hypothetical protein
MAANPIIFELWREASALAQRFDEAVLATAPESFDFVVLARVRHQQHKIARTLSGRLQIGPSGRAIAKPGRSPTRSHQQPA